MIVVRLVTTFVLALISEIIIIIMFTNWEKETSVWKRDEKAKDSYQS